MFYYIILHNTRVELIYRDDLGLISLLGLEAQLGPLPTFELQIMFGFLELDQAHQLRYMNFL